MQTVILSAGFGGQGVMVLGQLLGLAACEDGKEATFYPYYGPEQRGGTASCTTIIADERIGTPVTKFCDVFAALNMPSLLKFQDTVRPGGLIVADTSIAKSGKVRDDVEVFSIDSEKLATAAGSPRIANIVLSAAIAGRMKLFSKESLEAVVREKLGKKKNMLEMNLAALEAGWRFAG